MLLSNLAKTFALLALSLITIQSTKAQPVQYNKIFYPQTKENIAVMKKSPQKMVIAYSQDPVKIVGDSSKHISFIKKYDTEGRLVFHHDYLMNTLTKYSYDNKGRVTAYYEELINLKPVLNFAVTYTKKGAITAIKNTDNTKQAQSISYNSNTQTIVISDVGGSVYRYTLNKKNRLIHAKVAYYMSTSYNATLSYTKKGLLQEEKGTKEIGSSLVTFTTKYLYNKGILVKTITTSQPKGIAVEEIKNENYSYNNSLLSSREINDNGSKTSYHYTYDNLQRITKSTYTKADLLYGAEFYVYR